MDKNAIKKFAVEARRELIKRVSLKASRYGITAEGWGDDNADAVNGVVLTVSEQSQRKELIEQIRDKGFEQVMEEVAYTWFNRFIALRFMEVNNYLPTKVRVFTNENNAFEPQIIEEALDMTLDGLDVQKVIAYKNAEDKEGLYRYLLIVQCNALSEILPEMFERIDNYTELLLPDNLLREESVIAQMLTIPEEDWNEQVQIIGWLYQYYNTEPKDKVFADLKKNIKIGADAIPAATQLFTPDWIVRYMVENSLGRMWTEGHGNPDNAEWKYYLEEAEQEESVKAELEKLRAEYRNIQPEQIKFIDPCMGSGHILVYAFDVLMQIYVSCGWSERDAAQSIIRHNLYGLDIDRRAYQLAYFAVMMKARQYNRRIISAENQPNLANFADVMDVDTSMLSGSIRQFAEQFRDADIYGSLMTVTAPKDIDDAVSDFIPVFGITSRQLDMMMKIYKFLGQKYDVVCTNPPYMGGSGMNAKLSDFVKAKFADSKSDLFACFIEKAYQLAKPSGYTSLITMESWMFLSSFESLRAKINTTKTIINMVHMPYLGKGGTSLGINFGTAAVVTKNSRIADYTAQYEYTVYYETDENGVPFVFPTINEHWKTAKQENFSKIPGMPVAYWVSEAFSKAFEDGTLLEKLIPVKKGMDTGDNDHFLRLWFEIEYNKLDLINHSKKWIPYDKGGEYRRWYGNNDYVVNWENDGFELKNSKANLRSKQLYFRPSITWSALTTANTSFRYSKFHGTFDSAGSSMFPAENDIPFYLGIMNTYISQYYLNVINPTMNYGAGSMGQIPIIKPVITKILSNVNGLVNDNISLSEEDWDSFETSWDFERHPLI